MKVLNIISLTVILLFTTIICGCSGIGDPEKPLSVPSNAVVPIEPMPNKMITDIYWDATVSMQGFTRLASGNVYRSLPDIMGDLASSPLGKDPGEVHFFRFGEQITPIEGREYRRFINPDYYTETITSFSSVLDVADPTHLSIVVTDLFENDADWSNVTQKLREKYFSKHLTVAIMGIKNPFMGEIYDVGLNAATYSHNSGDDPNMFRPFYLFLMGPEIQVRTFMTKLKESQSQEAEIECAVFSEHFTPQVFAFNLASAKEKQNLFEDRQLQKSDERLQEIGIANHKENVHLSLVGKCQLSPYICLSEENLNNLDPQINIYSLNSDEQWERQDLGKGVKSTFSFQGGDSTLNVTFPPDGVMPRGKIGLLQIKVAPTKDNLDIPQWLNDWDMGDIDANPDSFDGSKTVNLKRIANSLKDSLLAAANPTLAEFYLVVDGR